LADALSTALGDGAPLAAMGARSARRAAAWGEDACLASFVQAVESVVGRR
jgi:hypothetical protein